MDTLKTRLVIEIEHDITANNTPETTAAICANLGLTANLMLEGWPRYVPAGVIVRRWGQCVDIPEYPSPRLEYTNNPDQSLSALNRG